MVREDFNARACVSWNLHGADHVWQSSRDDVSPSLNALILEFDTILLKVLYIFFIFILIRNKLENTLFDTLLKLLEILLQRRRISGFFENVRIQKFRGKKRMEEEKNRGTEIHIRANRYNFS